MKQLFPLFFFTFFIIACNQNDANQASNQPDSFEKTLEENAENDAFPSIGEQIEAARVKKGLSQSQLATAAGLSAENIAAIEKNRVVPSRDMMVSLQKVLEVELVVDSNF